MNVLIPATHALQLQNNQINLPNLARHDKIIKSTYKII